MSQCEILGITRPRNLPAFHEVHLYKSEISKAVKAWGVFRFVKRNYQNVCNTFYCSIRFFKKMHLPVCSFFIKGRRTLYEFNCWSGFLVLCLHVSLRVKTFIVIQRWQQGFNKGTGFIFRVVFFWCCIFKKRGEINRNDLS